MARTRKERFVRTLLGSTRCPNLQRVSEPQCAEASVHDDLRDPPDTAPFKSRAQRQTRLVSVNSLGCRLPSSQPCQDLGRIEAFCPQSPRAEASPGKRYAQGPGCPQNEVLRRAHDAPGPPQDAAVQAAGIGRSDVQEPPRPQPSRRVAQEANGIRNMLEYLDHSDHVERPIHKARIATRIGRHSPPFPGP